MEIKASSRIKVLGALSTIMQKKHPTITEVSIAESGVELINIGS